jgi:hypothetical protein
MFFRNLKARSTVDLDGGVCPPRQLIRVAWGRLAPLVIDLPEDEQMMEIVIFTTRSEGESISVLSVAYCFSTLWCSTCLSVSLP